MKTEKLFITNLQKFAYNTKKDTICALFYFLFFCFGNTSDEVTMKKYLFLLLFGIVALSLGIVFAVRENKTSTTNADFLRVHIRANSNSEEDQAVKYKVKEKVVEFLSPRLADCKNKEESIEVTSNNLNQIIDIANAVLKDNGFDYSCDALICIEKFPTRSYGDLVLDEGYYDALILKLGTGSGNNWWCVMFPPLCFVGAEGNEKIVYESKIWNIIKKYS